MAAACSSLTRRPRQYRRLAARRHPRRGGRVVRCVSVGSPPSARRGRSTSSRRAWASCSPGPRSPPPARRSAPCDAAFRGRARMVRARRHRRRGPDATTRRRRSRAPRRCCPVLGTVLVLVAGGAGRLAGRAGRVLRPPGGAVDRPALVRDLPLALAGARALRGPVRAAVARRRALAVVAVVGRPGRGLRPPRRGPGPSPPLARRAPARGLALGAALCSLALAVGVDSRGHRPGLDTGRGRRRPRARRRGARLPAPAATTDRCRRPSTRRSAGAATTPVTAADRPTPGALAGGDLDGLRRREPAAVLAQGLAVTDVPSNLRPSLGPVGADRAAVYADGCVAIGVETELDAVPLRDPDAPITVVLYGDSHAAQWFPPLIEHRRGPRLRADRAHQGRLPDRGGVDPDGDAGADLSDLARRGRSRSSPPSIPTSSSSARWADYPEHRRRVGRRASTTTLSRGWRRSPTDLVVLGDNPPATSSRRRACPTTCAASTRARPQRADVVPASRIAVERAVAAALRGDVRRHHRLAVHATRRAR